MTYSNPAAYDSFMGRWSARLAPLFISFVGVRKGQRILDVGCGTGALSHALLVSAEMIEVVGVDPISSFAAYARKEVASRCSNFHVAPVEALPFPDATFDATLSLLVLQDLADADRAMLEMVRVTRRGGVVAACKWDFASGLPMLSLFWQAAEAVAGEAVARHRADQSQQPLARAGLRELADLWTGCGLSTVRTTTLDLSLQFNSFEDYWLPFLGGATPTSTFAAMINRETGGAVARVLRDKIPNMQANGSFVLPARAWAVAGIAH